VALPGVAAAAALVTYALLRPHAESAPVLGLALLLAALGAGVWRRASARAVLPGLLAGLVPFFVPAVAMRAGVSCGLRDCTELCLVSCLLGGLVAGGLVAWRSTALAKGRRTFLVVAGGVGTLAGTLGCVAFGFLGLLLLLGGMALIPSWALARASVET
jgi:putative effector of murein hydrolase LrgA (UPF0299 family)